MLEAVAEGGVGRHGAMMGGREAGLASGGGTGSSEGRGDVLLWGRKVRGSACLGSTVLLLLLMLLLRVLLMMMMVMMLMLLLLVMWLLLRVRLLGILLLRYVRRPTCIVGMRKRGRRSYPSIHVMHWRRLLHLLRVL